jgi:hypothetical protein
MEEHELQQRSREPSRRRSPDADPHGERALDPRSGAAGLQQRLGNAGVVQLCRALQRQSRSDEELEEGLDAADATLSPTAGSPLDRDTRAHAEQGLGVSLEGVNVVQKADSATAPLDAKAFAASDGAGRHSIALSSDVDLGSQDGEFTLMHELAHVAQQKQGQADSLDGIGGDESARERLEDEADRRARGLLRGG